MVKRTTWNIEWCYVEELTETLNKLGERWTIHTVALKPALHATERDVFCIVAYVEKDR